MGGQALPWEFDPDLEGKLSTKPSERFPVSFCVRIKSHLQQAQAQKDKRSKPASECPAPILSCAHPIVPLHTFCIRPHTFAM